LNLRWAIRAKGKDDQETVTLPNNITRNYSGDDAKTLALRLMWEKTKVSGSFSSVPHTIKGS